MKKNIVFWFILLILAMTGCTENPFEKDANISNSDRRIAGTIQLGDNDDPAGVYVWLEVFNVGTVTDEQGEFLLMIPPAASQPGGGLDGIFKVYYLLANYEVETSSVVVRGGRFDHSVGDFTDDGNLPEPMFLRKAFNLSVETQFVAEVPGHPAAITAEMHFTPFYGTTTEVEFPQPVPNWLGAYILRKIKTVNQADVVTDELIHSSNSVMTTEIIKMQEDYAIYTNLNANTMDPDARYIIIPIVYAQNNVVPDELLASLNLLDEPVAMNYLNYPIRTFCAEFRWPDVGGPK